MMRKKSKPKELIQQSTSQEHGFSWANIVLAVVGIFIASLAFWYQFIRVDESLTAKVDLMYSFADTLLIEIFVHNNGNRPVTLVDMQFMLFHSDTLPLSITPLGILLEKPTLPLIVRENENHLLTSKILFRLSDYYPFSHPVRDVSSQKGERIAYIGINWSATNSKGSKFSNFSILGHINMDTVSGLNSTGGSFREDPIDLFTQFSLEGNNNFKGTNVNHVRHFH